MKFDPKIHHRRSVRMAGYDYTQPGAYFVTLVTHGREEIFGKIADREMQLNNLGEIAREQWERLYNRFPHIECRQFVVMPNHVHGIIVIANEGRSAAREIHKDVMLNNTLRPEMIGRSDKPVTGRSDKPATPLRGVEEGSLGAIVRAYKSAVAYRVNVIRQSPGAPVWQRNYYEHIVRDEIEYKAIWDYIVANPEQWMKDQLHPSSLI
jgi:putative transposase